MSTEPIVKPAPKPRTPMSNEAKERARAKARCWYAEHREHLLARKREAYREDPAAVILRNAKWAEMNPEKAAAIAKRSAAKQRDAAILAAPVIHDADRFERIQEVMASNREKKYGI